MNPPYAFLDPLREKRVIFLLGNLARKKYNQF